MKLVGSLDEGMEDQGKCFKALLLLLPLVHQSTQVCAQL